MVNFFGLSEISDPKKAVLIFFGTFLTLSLSLLTVKYYLGEALLSTSAITRASEFLVASVATTSLYIAIKKFLMNRVHSITIDFGVFSLDREVVADDGLNCRILNNGPNLVTIQNIEGYGVKKAKEGHYEFGLFMEFLEKPLKSGEEEIFQLFDAILIYECSHVGYKTSDQKFASQKSDFRKGLRPPKSHKDEADEEFVKICDLHDYIKELVHEDYRHGRVRFSEEEIKTKELPKLKELARKRT